MKMLVIALGLLTSVANAEMKPLGTFVPSKCASSQSGTVCMGSKVGLKGSYVSVAVQRSLQVIYKVKSKVPTNGGINPKASASVLKLVSDDGRRAKAVIRSMNGKPTSAVVTLENDHVVSVGAFEIVYTTM